MTHCTVYNNNNLLYNNAVACTSMDFSVKDGLLKFQWRYDGGNG